MSDIHFCDQVSLSTLVTIGRKHLDIRPDIICITGDLIHDSVRIMNNERYKSFIEWLYIIAKIAPVYLVKGEHDSLTFDKTTVFGDTMKIKYYLMK